VITAPGSYNISFEEYLDDPCPEPSLSRSTIKDLLECPAKAFNNHPRLNPVAEEKGELKFDIGTAAHALLLQGDDVAEVIDAKDYKTNAARDARTAARIYGKVPLLTHQYNEVRNMLPAARYFLQYCELSIHDLQKEGDSELTYIWQEQDIWCRIRPDWISKNRNLIIDYKTTASLSPASYEGIASQTGLDIQDAFYRRGVEAVEGTQPDFIFLVQEIQSPYLCALITLDMMFKDMGEQKVECGIRKWRKCLKYNDWEDYGGLAYTIEPKPWALASWEMKRGELGL